MILLDISHNYLLSKAFFPSSIFPISNPPSYLEQETLSKFTLSNLFATITGMENKDKKYIGKLYETNWISVDLPPWERKAFIQLSSPLPTFIIMNLQRSTAIGLPPWGKPRDFIGQHQLHKANGHLIFEIHSPHIYPHHFALIKLSLNPEALQNTSTIGIILSTSFFLPWQNRTISKSMKIIFNVRIMTLNPLQTLPSQVFINNLLNTFAYKTKRNRDRCLRIYLQVYF